MCEPRQALLLWVTAHHTKRAAEKGVRWARDGDQEKNRKRQSRVG